MSLSYYIAAKRSTAVSGVAKSLLLEIADRADRARGLCEISIRDIAAAIGWSRRAIQNNLPTLEALGLIQREARTGCRNRYRLNPQMLEGLQLTDRQREADRLADQRRAERESRRAAANSVPPERLEWGATTAGTCAPDARPPAHHVHPNTAGNCLKTISAPPAEVVHIEGMGAAAPAGQNEKLIPEPLAGLPAPLLDGFARVRRSKRKAAMPTPEQAAMLASEGQSAGLCLADVLRLCTRKGWATFQAAWVKPWMLAELASTETPASGPALPPPVQAAQEGCTQEGTRAGLAMLAAMRAAWRDHPMPHAHHAPRGAATTARHHAPMGSTVLDHFARAIAQTPAPA